MIDKDKAIEAQRFLIYFAFGKELVDERQLPEEDVITADQLRELIAFKEAVIDALVVNHIYRKEHDTDARQAVLDLIIYEGQLALDPLISKEAAELRDTYKAERDQYKADAEPVVVWMAQDKMKQVIFSSEDLANKYVCSYGASVAGGMNVFPMTFIRK